MQAGLYALLFFVACGQAVAHQQKIAITTVLFNPRTENIEIMHRFNLHDAEHAVKAMFKKTADILDDKDTLGAMILEGIALSRKMFPKEIFPLGSEIISESSLQLCFRRPKCIWGGL